MGRAYGRARAGAGRRVTKRDYQALADTLARVRSNYGPFKEAQDALTDVARLFAETLHKGNPRFDPERFLGACGVNLAG